MKKLMIALSAVAAAIFAVGTARGDGQVFNAVDFESYTATAFDASKTDDGTSSSGDRYWFSTSNDGNVISNYEAGVGLTGSDVPDYLSNITPNNNYLYLDTSAPLFRTVNSNSQDPEAFTGQSIGDGIYLDTLVKFTAADSAFSDNLTDGDKIAIEYVEHESEAAPGDFSYTNFVIRAGWIDNGQVKQTNYYAALPANFNKDEWYRLTVRTISDVGDGHVGFVVYLNQNPLTYTNDVATGLGELNAVAGAFHTAKQLYPSAVDAEATGGSTISAASFSGTGAIDDVVFTSVKPNFIAANELVPATITLGTGISSVTVTIGETTYNPVDATASPLVFNLPAGTESFNLAVTADSANGYTFAGIEGANFAAGAIATSGVVTWSGAAPTFTVLATRNGVSYIDENDQLVSCRTLSQAFASVKDGGTIKLAYDFTVATDETTINEQAKYDLDPNKAIVLDLNGNTLNGGTGAVELFYIASGSLTVIDSVGGGKIVYDGFSIFGTEATIDIGAATGDMGPTIDGLLFTANAEGNIIRAKVLASENSDNDAFLWVTSVDPDSEVASETVNGYWVVAPSGEEPPTPPTAYAVSITGGANAICDATTNGVAIADGDLIEDGASIVVVATPETGYEYATTPDGWSAGETEGTITKTYTVNGAALTITIPDATAKTIIGTYQVTVIPTNNATYTVTGAASNAGDVYTVATGHSITITVTPDSNYEYAPTPAGWTAGEGGVITKEISAAGSVEIPGPTAKQQGGYPTYIGDDAAKQAKYDEWKAAYVDDVNSEYEEAFLLNCAPGDVETEKAAFKLNITVVGSTVTVTGPEGKNYNGTIQLKGSNDLSTWTDVSAGSTDYKFYKAELK